MPVREICNLKDPHRLRDDQDLLEVFGGEEEDTGSLSSSSSSSSLSDMFPEGAEEVAAAVTPPPPPSPPGACAAPAAMEAPAMSPPQGAGPSCQGEQRSSPEGRADPQSSLNQALNLKMPELVMFLLLKYRANELTTKAEMLSSVIREYEEHFPEIFRRASECLQVLFGVDVKAVDPSGHFYVLVNTLGLTYDGMGRDGHLIPKNGLLIILLCVILMEGECAPEERVWQVLNDIGVPAGMEHFIFGEPMELITNVWVQEQYLEYRQVPNSNPARYEFLWGPRAHAETTRGDVLELMRRVCNRDAGHPAPPPAAAENREEEGP